MAGLTVLGRRLASARSRSSTCECVNSPMLRQLYEASACEEDCSDNAGCGMSGCRAAISFDLSARVSTFAAVYLTAKLFEAY
jgi:hypothetical protein